MPRKVACSEEGKVTIGSSDNGCVYILNRCTGELIEILHHAGMALAQTITVSLYHFTSECEYSP